MDKGLKKQLQHYVHVFQDGQQRGINEADTVMYLTRFLTDVFGYDLFTDLTKEFQVRDRYCDIAVKIDNQVQFLVEAKAMPTVMADRHIEQAGNYASRAGIPWVVLTNGVAWRLYHLTFDSNGIEHDLAFEVQLTPDTDLEEAWNSLGVLSRASVTSGALETFWQHKKTLSPASLVRALFTEEVLNTVRRDLHRKADVRLDLEDVAQSLRRLLNPEVLTEDIKIRKARKKRKRPVAPADGPATAPDEEMETEGDEPATAEDADVPAAEAAERPSVDSIGEP